MFGVPARADNIKITRWLAVFLLAVTVGVTVVDMQLNSLTQRHEFAQLLNLHRDPREGYSAYFFGQNYPIGALFPAAKIHSSDQELVLEAGGQVLRLPTKMNIDVSHIVYWSRIWMRQFAVEAYKTKAALTLYAAEFYRETAEYYERCRSLLQGESGK